MIGAGGGLALWSLLAALFYLGMVLSDAGLRGPMSGFFEVCGVFAFPLPMLGWLFIWGDNGPPPPFGNMVFIFGSSILLYCLLGAIAGAVIGLFRNRT